MTSTQTIEELSAQCAAKYGITREMIDHAERWTETDGDLEGLSEERVRGILDMRFGAIAVDTPRSELWHTPDTIDVIEDIPYLPDGGYDTEAGQCRGHLLDLYLPHDAVLRCGHTLPVYIDIHGGGFTYGYKELNRNLRASGRNGLRRILTELPTGPANRFEGSAGGRSGGIALDQGAFD